MKRVNELEEYISEYWNNQIEQKRTYIQKQEMLVQQELCQQVEVLIKDQVKRQVNDGQRVLKHLFLCRLKSSGYTGSYEVILGLSNSMLYLDKDKSDTYWYPKFVYDTVEEDMEAVTVELRKKFACLEKYELFYLKQKLLCGNWKLLELEYTKAMNRIYEQLCSSSLVLDNVMLMLSGEYMEQLQIVRRMEKRL